jgi:hypothetical protein
MAYEVQGLCSNKKKITGSRIMNDESETVTVFFYFLGIQNGTKTMQFLLEFLKRAIQFKKVYIIFTKCHVRTHHELTFGFQERLTGGITQQHINVCLYNEHITSSITYVYMVN